MSAPAPLGSLAVGGAPPSACDCGVAYGAFAMRRPLTAVHSQQKHVGTSR